jgi:hypothetical protein
MPAPMKDGSRLLAALLGTLVTLGAAGAALGPWVAPSHAEDDEPPPPGFGPDRPEPEDLEDGEDADEGDEGDEEPAGPALTPEQLAAARALLEAGRDAQARKQFAAARKKLQELLEKYPGAPEEMRIEAEDRSAENCFLGYEQIRFGGPPPNRIDVELMGDGYLLAQQTRFRDHAEAQIGDFYRDPLYDEYEGYFNVWRFDLASKEEGVDEVARPEPPPRDPTKPPKKKKRKRRPLKEYSTALNCQAAGPQNQVWADPRMVMRWRKYLPVSDGLTIAFAKKGSLGMGGMGIATTGRRVAVVHEFGHAFVGLLDEYAVNPGAPQGAAFVSAANAVPGKGPKEPPDLKDVPWKHWIDAKNKDVDLFLGGATFQLGVYRPAADCAMNTGGSSPYCWVCREEGLLRIYEYVSPVDASSPAEASVWLGEKEVREFSVTPMVPKTHALDVSWYLDRAPDVTGPAAGDAPADDAVPPADRRGAWRRGRARQPAGPPPGKRLSAVVRKGASGSRSCVDVGPLAAGVWRLTAVVVDKADVPGFKFPWVLSDPDRRLEERRVWTIEVGPPQKKPLKVPKRGSD